MTTSFLQELSKRKFSVVLTGIVFAAAIFVAFMFTEERYKVGTDFLVIQNQGTTQDIYTLSRSNEYMTTLLGEAVYSELFINEAIQTGFMESSMLPADRQDRLKEWKRMVGVSKNFQGNILTVEVKGDSKSDLQRTSKAIAEVLTQKNSLFRSGTQDSMEVRILSGPLIDRNPSLSVLALVMSNGFLIGVALAVFRAYVRFSREEAMFASWEDARKREQ